VSISWSLEVADARSRFRVGIDFENREPFIFVDTITLTGDCQIEVKIFRGDEWVTRYRKELSHISSNENPTPATIARRRIMNDVEPSSWRKRCDLASE
jgi:hypothetical protein